MQNVASLHVNTQKFPNIYEVKEAVMEVEPSIQKLVVSAVTRSHQLLDANVAVWALGTSRFSCRNEEKPFDVLPVSDELANTIAVLDKRHLSSTNQPCAHKPAGSLGGLSDSSFLEVQERNFSP